MNEFAQVAELEIGTVVEVAGSAVRVELDGKISELTRTFRGRVYPIGQFASVIKIHFGRRILFAYVRLLRMRSEIEREAGRPAPPPSEDSRVIEADLFGEGFWQASVQKLDFSRGVRNYPLPGQKAYLTTQEELRAIYQKADLDRDDGLNPMIPIGVYAAAETTTCHADLDKLFGLHCAVLGSTGAGKSATVAAVLHAVLQHKPRDSSGSTLRPRIIIIDPHAEYGAAFRDRAIVYRPMDDTTGETPSAGDDVAVVMRKPLRLPYWLMSGEEFRELVIGKSEYEATTEHNIVYKGLVHARLVKRGLIEASKEWVGQSSDVVVDPDAPRPVRDDAAVRAAIAQYDRDTPDPFSLDEFVRYVNDEQGIVVESRAKKWQKMSSSAFKSHASVLDKLSVLRTDPRLAFMMEEYKDGDPDLPEILQQFVGSADDGADNVDIRIVDISGVPNEVAGPLTAALARVLFQYKVWQTPEERDRDPVLLVCEEAHRYVPDTGLAEYQSAQKSIRRIAKEGRKYGIGLMLVSQRPADVERTVLSQCNTWMVMRLSNATDQEHVNRFLPDSLTGLSRMLPSLSRQEAIFVGEAAAVPARIIVRTLEERELPRSKDIPFVGGWSLPPVSQGDIAAVVNRWRKQP